MPRNGSGAFSLSKPAFTANTTIVSGDVNSDLSDLATAMTGSLAADGQTTLTGQLKGTQGVNPSYSFTGDTSTGFGSVSTGEADIYISGTKIAAYTSTGLSLTGALTVSTSLAVTGATTHTGAVTFNGGGALGGSTFSGTGIFSGAISFTSTIAVTGKASFTSTDSMAMANGTTGQRNGAPTAGDVRYNSTLNGLEWFNGTIWIVQGQAPTVQKFISGSAQTYTPGTGVVRIKVRMVGGGGGGGGASANNGANGTDTSFGTWTAIHGVGGGANFGTLGTGGSGGVDGTPGLLVFRVVGGGGGGGASDSATIGRGGGGGVNPFGGAGIAGLSQSATAGANGSTNTGGGGSGGSNGATGGSGGGAGEYVEFWVSSPGATLYTVGGGGNGGVAGGKAGGNGAAGIIIIEEFYS